MQSQYPSAGGTSTSGATSGKVSASPATPRAIADETQEFEHLIADISRNFVRATVDDIDSEINRSLQRVCLLLGLDRSTLAQIDPSNGAAAITHGWACDPARVFPTNIDPNRFLPWHKQKMLAREMIIYSDLDELPQEAAIDRETLRPIGPKSAIVLPVTVGGVTFGALAFDAMYEHRPWPPELVQQLQFVADIFGHALDRKRSVADSLRLQNELAHVSRVATLGELTASLAHELNQPLGTILSNTEAVQLLLQSARPDMVEIGAALDEIAESDKRATEIIRRFRALFKRGELNKSRCSPAELLEVVQRVIKSEAAIRRVTLSFDCPSPLPPILADPIALQQVLLNLILNGFDSICAVENGKRELSVNASMGQAGFTQFTVRDSGSGISPEVMPRLFDAFFTTKPNGMGMGLTVARSIIEAHGGCLWAVDNPDGGAIFEFTVPSAAGPGAHCAANEAGQTSYQIVQPRKIAVIDDDSLQRSSLLRLLASAGHEVRGFGSATEFLVSAELDGFSCVVSDVRMPVVDGLELQEALRAKYPYVPLLLITGDAGVPDSVKAIKSGAADFLEKPVKSDVLLEAIDQAIVRGDRSRSAARELNGLKLRFQRLTPRERQVFALVSAGLLNKQVAAELGAAEKTIKQHRGRVMNKMKAESAAELVVMADRLGVRPADDFSSAKGRLKPG